VRDIEGFYFATYRRWRGSKSDGFEDEADWEATDVTNARGPRTSGSSRTERADCEAAWRDCGAAGMVGRRGGRGGRRRGGVGESGARGMAEPPRRERRGSRREGQVLGMWWRRRSTGVGGKLRRRRRLWGWSVQSGGGRGAQEGGTIGDVVVGGDGVVGRDEGGERRAGSGEGLDGPDQG